MNHNPYYYNRELKSTCIIIKCPCLCACLCLIQEVTIEVDLTSVEASIVEAWVGFPRHEAIYIRDAVQ